MSKIIESFTSLLGRRRPLDWDELRDITDEDVLRTMVESRGYPGMLDHYKQRIREADATDPEPWITAFPSWRSDMFCRSDFHCKTLKRQACPLFIAMLWYLACVYWNNLMQAWLQANVTGFYEGEWGYSKNSTLEANEFLQRHQPDVYKARWGGRPVNYTVFDAGLKASEITPGILSQRYTNAMQKYYSKQTVTLYDNGFIYLPLVNGSTYADAFAGGSALFGLVRFVLVPGPMSMRWTYLTRVFLIWGTIFLCRGITIGLTPLPNPYHQCKPTVTFPDNIWWEAYALLPITPQYSDVTCQDVMFSGHTAMGTTFTLFTLYYAKKAPWNARMLAGRGCLTDLMRVLFTTFCVVWVFCGWYVIFGAHFHYSVDVATAAVLSFFIFRSYHQAVFSNEFTTTPRHMNVVVGDCYSRFLHFMEHEAADVKHQRLLREFNKKREFELQLANNAAGSPPTYSTQTDVSLKEPLLA